MIVAALAATVALARLAALADPSLPAARPLRATVWSSLPLDAQTYVAESWRSLLAAPPQRNRTLDRAAVERLARIVLDGAGPGHYDDRAARVAVLLDARTVLAIDTDGGVRFGAARLALSPAAMPRLRAFIEEFGPWPSGPPDRSR